MSDLEAARNHQKIFLQGLKDKKEPYLVNVQGVDITVHPGVFPPVTDSQLLASHISVSSGTKVLDLTTGSGVFAVIAGIQGAKGLAADINPAAVVNAKENFERFGVGFKALQSDLFNNVHGGGFDLITVNGPYTEGKVIDPLEHAFYGARRFLTRLFSEASEYLDPEGKMLITFAEWGEVDFLEKTASRNNFTLKFLDKKFSDNKRVYRLYEAMLNL